jgi:hypothetical protein
MVNTTLVLAEIKKSAPANTKIQKLDKSRSNICFGNSLPSTSKIEDLDCLHEEVIIEKGNTKCKRFKVVGRKPSNHIVMMASEFKLPRENEHHEHPTP